MLSHAKDSPQHPTAAGQEMQFGLVAGGLRRTQQGRNDQLHVLRSVLQCNNYLALPVCLRHGAKTVLRTAEDAFRNFFPVMVAFLHTHCCHYRGLWKCGENVALMLYKASSNGVVR